jgi:Cu+-exporting ATPase
MATHIDPVCGMSVDDRTQQQSTYQGKTYYFCCEQCKKQFDQDPEQYLQPSITR